MFDRDNQEAGRDMLLFFFARAVYHSNPLIEDTDANWFSTTARLSLSISLPVLVKMSLVCKISIVNTVLYSYSKGFLIQKLPELMDSQYRGKCQLHCTLTNMIQDDSVDSFLFPPG